MGANLRSLEAAQLAHRAGWNPRQLPEIGRAFGIWIETDSHGDLLWAWVYLTGRIEVQRLTTRLPPLQER